MATNQITTEPSLGSAPGLARNLAELTDAIGELSALERETLARTRRHPCPRWKVAGRDRQGQLALATLVPAGVRWPGKQRLTLLTIAADGLYYQDQLVDATDLDAGTSATADTSDRPQVPPNPRAGS
jgi:hypothetical protein